VKINPEKIRRPPSAPAARNIKRIVEESGCEINIEDDGTVNIYSTSAERHGSRPARNRRHDGRSRDWQIYRGRVVTIKEFGCFVEFLPGKDGLAISASWPTSASNRPKTSSSWG